MCNEDGAVVIQELLLAIHMSSNVRRNNIANEGGSRGEEDDQDQEE